MAGLPPPGLRPGTTLENGPVSALMTLACGVVIVAALSIARDVFIPITFAVLLSFVLAPLVNLLRRLWLGRVLAVLLAVLAALGVMLGAAGIIGAQIAGLAGDIPRYSTTIQHKVVTIQGVTVGRLSAVVDRMTKQLDRGSHPLPADGPAGAGTAAPDRAATPPDNQATKPIPVEVHQPDPSATELAERVLAPILSPMATTAIIVVVAIFILLQREDLRDRLIRLLGTSDLHRTMTAMDEAGHRLSRYFLILLALNTVFGCVIGLGLFLIGVPSPVLWGIVAVLLRFVPYVGSPISAVLPLALAAAVDPGWSLVLWTGGLFVACEVVMGQAIEPLAYGRSTGLSPVAVVIAAIFWGWLWGPLGLILSMPMTLCLVILGRHVERLQFLDVLLGDQPALTPVESFYNRMLTGRLDEVQDDAEQFLKSHALSVYYDEVAVRALRLAAADIERGILTEAQAARITGSVEALLDELADYDGNNPVLPPPHAGPVDPLQDLLVPPVPVAGGASDAGGLPPEWRAAGAVMCVAGRGPFDEVVSAMLAHLLGKCGFGTRVVPHAAVSARTAIGALDMTGVRIVCLIYGGIAGTSTHLRYTVRRLRARTPDATILAGLWHPDMAADDRLRVAIAADGYAASLGQFVTDCLARATTPAGGGGNVMIGPADRPHD